jgi:succinyl-CoA synthetase alpha subunit
LSILVDRNTRLLVQGITGREGEFHTTQMVAYGTNVVAGVTPGGGGKAVAGVPVYDTVRQAVEETEANTSIVFVPAPFAPDAVYEAAANGIGLIVCITEGIPALDEVRMYRYVRDAEARLLGPNCPGLTTVGEAKVGIIPGNIHTRGPVGLVSRSGTLTYEAVAALTAAEIGQSTVVGIGGDPVPGTTFVDVLRLFEEDPETRSVVLIGEIGGAAEEEAAEYIRSEMSKPVVAFIAGRTAPPGRRMGHAGAIISGGRGTAEEKLRALEAANVQVATSPAEIADLVDVAMAAG